MYTAQMNIHISNNNSKIGNVMNISLTPRKSCPKGVPCGKKCYAIKSYRMYPAVKTAWDENYKIFKRSPAKYFKQIADAIRKKRKQPEYFRYHVAGDIVNQRYLDGMKNVAEEFPNTKFLAFTKNFDLEFGRIPKNLNIILSAWTGYRIPASIRRKFVVSYVEDPKDMDFRIGLLKNKEVCPGECTPCGFKCWHKKKGNIIFHKH